MQQAVWFHHVGDYSEEQRLLRTLLADPQITLAQLQEARFQLALSYLADEQPASAANVLEQFSLQAGSLSADDPLRSRTVFLRAQALAAVGRNAEAVAAYEAFLQQHPQVTGVVEERIADAWLAAGDWPQAANALRRAANHAARNWEKVVFSTGWPAFSRAMAAGARPPLSTMKSLPRLRLKREHVTGTTPNSMQSSATEYGPSIGSAICTAPESPTPPPATRKQPSPAGGWLWTKRRKAIPPTSPSSNW